MIVRYSLHTYSDGTPYGRVDQKGNWIKALDVEEALKNVAREISASSNEDPETVLRRVAVALEARRERIAELEAELTRRNRLINSMVGGRN